MTSFKYIALIISILLIVNSCKKQTETLDINGLISENDEGILNDVTVKLFIKEVSNSTWNNSYLLHETISSNDGSYQFTIENKVYISFKLEVSKSGFYTETIEFITDDFTNNTYHKNFNIYPQGTLQIHIKNANPVNQDDNMTYNLVGNMPTTYQCCDNEDVFFNGIEIDEIKTCKVFGNYNIPIKWSTFKANTFKEYFDTIYTIKNDTTYYEILY